MAKENFDSQFGLFEFKWLKPMDGPESLRLKTVHRFNEFLATPIIETPQVTEVVSIQREKLVVYPPAEVPFLHLTFAETVADRRSAIDFVTEFGMPNPEVEVGVDTWEQRIDEIIDTAIFMKSVLRETSMLNIVRQRIKAPSYQDLKGFSAQLLARLSEVGAPQLKLCPVPKDGSPFEIVPKFIPLSLLDYMWIHCIFETAGNHIVRRCDGCGRPLLIDGNSNKARTRHLCPRVRGNNKCALRAKRNKEKGITPTWR